MSFKNAFVYKEGKQVKVYGARLKDKKYNISLHEITFTVKDKLEIQNNLRCFHILHISELFHYNKINTWNSPL